jgi:hypothetical protein
MCTVSDTWTDCYSFVCATTGADDPVREMWGQAQLAWGLESLEGEVKCLVTIGTRVPSLMFKDSMRRIGETLVAKRFRRESALLKSMGRYHQFNMVEKIRLGEAKKAKAVAAQRHNSSQSDMLACAGSISG